MWFLTKSGKGHKIEIFEVHPLKAGEGLDGPKPQKSKEQDVLTFFYLKTALKPFLGSFYPQIPVKNQKKSELIKTQRA